MWQQETLEKFERRTNLALALHKAYKACNAYEESKNDLFSPCDRIL